MPNIYIPSCPIVNWLTSTELPSCSIIAKSDKQVRWWGVVAEEARSSQIQQRHVQHATHEQT